MSNKIIEKLLSVEGKVEVLRENASTLPKDAWKIMDDKFLTSVKNRLSAVADLQSRGLVESLGELGFSNTIFEWQMEKSGGEAILSMDGNVKGNDDAVEYVTAGIPLPMCSKYFSLSARMLAASKTVGRPLDVSQVGNAGTVIAEKLENLLVNGADGFKYGGYNLYGYTTYPDRNTGSLTANWDTATASQILTDVMAMNKALVDDKFVDEKILYIPSHYATGLEADYSSAYPGVTIKDRILKVGSISKIQILDVLEGDQVLMINMNSENVRMIEGSAPTLISAESDNKMSTDYYAYAILVANLRSNSEGNTGISHWS